MTNSDRIIILTKVAAFMPGMGRIPDQSAKALSTPGISVSAAKTESTSLSHAKQFKLAKPPTPPAQGNAGVAAAGKAAGGQPPASVTAKS